MGGCRCTFRHCENSTSSKPGMHFFHFPIRDWPRLQLWAGNANKLEFMDLPLSKLKNKVVCQDHFENRMFMNYLKEALVKTAVPTLDVMDDGSVFNIVTNQISEPEQWIVPEKSHTAESDNVLEETPMETETTRMEIQFVGEDYEEFHITPVLSPSTKSKTHNPGSKKLITANNDNPSVPVTPPANAVLRKVVLKRKTKPAPENSQSHSKIQVLSVQRLPKKAVTETGRPEESIVEDVPSMAMPSSSTDVTVANESTEDEIQPPSAPETAAPPAPPAPPLVEIISDPAYVEKLDQATAQIAEVKKLLIDVLKKPVPEPKVITVPVPTPVPAPQPAPTPADEGSSAIEKGPHMNKVQLFNGIKRYLNPTMVALLRMELFAGAPERQWKADEKTLAVELVNLGESVYTHFLDEFRFRLPPKKDALKWKEEALDDDGDAS